jgi:hypothetical protein
MFGLNISRVENRIKGQKGLPQAFRERLWNNHQLVPRLLEKEGFKNLLALGAATLEVNVGLLFIQIHGFVIHSYGLTLTGRK